MVYSTQRGTRVETSIEGSGVQIALTLANGEIKRGGLTCSPTEPKVFVWANGAGLSIDLSSERELLRGLRAEVEAAREPAPLTPEQELRADRSAIVSRIEREESNPEDSVGYWRARQELREFDTAHPELLAELQAESAAREAERQERLQAEYEEREASEVRRLENELRAMKQ
jgi:hypothetical protein